MFRRSVKRLTLVSGGLAAIGLACVSPVFGDEPVTTWVGSSTTSSNWSDNANWSTNAQPAYGTLNFSGSNRTMTTMDGSYSMQSLEFYDSSWTINAGSGANLRLLDYGGTQSKIENRSGALLTLNIPVTYAATSGNSWGEINSVSGMINFTGSSLTVNGSAVSGIRMYSSGTINYNTTVNASGKYFDWTNSSGSVNVGIGGNFTSGDLYVQNTGSLSLNSGGTLTTSGTLYLGGENGGSGRTNTASGATFNLASSTGGQSFAGTINSFTGNTSNALIINSSNTTGTNTLSGGIFLDSPLTIENSAGGALALTGASNGATAMDVKSQPVTFSPSGTITVSGALSSSASAGGSVVLNGPGTLILSGTSNSYTGTNSNTLNANGTQIAGGGTLGIYSDTSLGLAPAGVYNNIQFTGNGTLQDTSSNISLSANRNVNVASTFTATIDNNGNAFTIPGVINGGGSLNFKGAGSTVLTGSNTYTGNTAVSAGTLVANTTGSGNSATGTGIVTVNSAGVLAGNGYTGAVNVAGGKITAGSGATTGNSIGTLHTGAQTWSSGTFVAKVNSAGTSNDQLVMSGLTVSASTGSPFVVALTGLSSSNPTMLTTTGIVLARDSNTGDLNVFKNAINAMTLLLSTTNITTAPGLAPKLVEYDPSGGGEELIAEADTASPEPTSFLLLGAVISPLLLGRRRRGATEESLG